MQRSADDEFLSSFSAGRYSDPMLKPDVKPIADQIVAHAGNAGKPGSHTAGFEASSRQKGLLLRAWDSFPSISPLYSNVLPLHPSAASLPSCRPGCAPGLVQMASSLPRMRRLSTALCERPTRLCPSPPLMCTRSV